MPAHHKRADHGIETPHSGPRAGDASYRAHFRTAEDYAAAMRLADQLERKGMPRRAWRVRLNLDGPQPVTAVVQVSVQSLYRQTGLSQSQIARRLGVSQQAVSKWACDSTVSRKILARIQSLIGAGDDD